MEHHIIVLPQKQHLEAAAGAKLMDVLQRAGCMISARAMPMR